MDADRSPDRLLGEYLGRYLGIVDACAPGYVEGLYVVGSYALGDWQPDHSDIDIIAVTAAPATDEDVGNLRIAHALLAEQQPRPFIDGPYVAWGDLVTPPMSLHRPWTLMGDLHHDGDCFELNPVTWYVLAEYGVTVRGPSVDQLGIVVDLEERVRFVTDNLDTYWRSIAADLIRATDADPSREFDAGSLEWCALGALRLHRTALFGDVISKLNAGQYGLGVAPGEFAPVLHHAMRIRAGEDPDQRVQGAELRRAAELIIWCADQATRPR